MPCCVQPSWLQSILTLNTAKLHVKSWKRSHVYLWRVEAMERNDFHIWTGQKNGRDADF